MADVSAIGSIMVPALKKAGYKSDETVSIVSAASAMGMLVPPSIPAVVLGGITGMSVGALFVGGFHSCNGIDGVYHDSYLYPVCPK